VPHLICGGFTKEETENALIDLHFLGIDNVLVLRGDARKGDADFIPTPGGHAYATDLLQQVADMNNGKYLHDRALPIPKKQTFASARPATRRSILKRRTSTRTSNG